LAASGVQPRGRGRLGTAYYVHWWLNRPSIHVVRDVIPLRDNSTSTTPKIRIHISLDEFRKEIVCHETLCGLLNHNEGKAAEANCEPSVLRPCITSVNWQRPSYLKNGNGGPTSDG
jgi:hypothetical protein